MKVYVGFKKDRQKGKEKHGITVYSNQGKLLYSAVTTVDLPQHKFFSALNSLLWGVRKLNPLINAGVLPKDEQIYLFIGNAVVYDWCAQSFVPQPYTDAHADLLLEFSALYNPVEVILSQTANSKVLFKAYGTNSHQQESALDFLNSLE